MAESGEGSSPRRNGSLRIPLPFEEALRAAVEAKPPEKPPRKPRATKKAAKGRKR